MDQIFNHISARNLRNLIFDTYLSLKLNIRNKWNSCHTFNNSVLVKSIFKTSLKYVDFWATYLLSSFKRFFLLRRTLRFLMKFPCGRQDPIHTPLLFVKFRVSNCGEVRRVFRNAGDFSQYKSNNRLKIHLG